MLVDVRCTNLVLNRRTGKLELCNKMLGRFNGAYSIRCPRCRHMCEGDTAGPRDQKSKYAN